MVVYLTSSPGGCYEENGRRIAAELDNANGFVDKLKKDWTENVKCLIISSAPRAFAMNDNMKEIFAEAFAMSGFPVQELSICDYRNVEVIDELAQYQVVLLAGGHVPTQNAFFHDIKLKEKLSAFDGILIGISAGTMNCAEVVYAQPELEGESLDKDYQRFIKGLGLTDLQILPHYQYIKGITLDGKRVMEDITYPDSMGRRFYALVDGSYIVLENGTQTLYGEGYAIEDGMVRKICENEAHMELA